MKPLASLSSTLLARKGQAKPAMRSQAFGVFQPPLAASQEDLGWNDMGQDAASAAAEPDPTPATVQALPPPPVLAEREELATRIERRPVSAATAARIGRESAAQTRAGKAAFTLRLEAERHLKLRLASAVANRSAQALVAEAVDRFIQTMPEVEVLAGQLPPPAAKPRGKRR